jgi:hypothetical protein
MLVHFGIRWSYVKDVTMKLTALILLAILPVAALAVQTGDDSTSDAQHQMVNDTAQQRPAISAQTQEDPLDPLPISKKKCLAVNKDGYCTQWAAN